MAGKRIVRFPCQRLQPGCGSGVITKCYGIAPGLQRKTSGRLRSKTYNRAVAAVDDFNWDDLRYFLRAAQTKTLAGAARSMGVEHTTIGRRLSALERALGAPLVLRGPDGLTLTPLGQRIAPLVLDVERAVSAARAAVKAECARVRLSVPQALTGLFTQALGATAA